MHVEQRGRNLLEHSPSAQKHWFWQLPTHESKLVGAQTSTGEAPAPCLLEEKKKKSKVRCIGEDKKSFMWPAPFLLQSSSVPRETFWACDFSHGGKWEQSECPASPAMRDTAHFFIASSVTCRGSAKLKRLGVTKTREKVVGIRNNHSKLNKRHSFYLLPDRFQDTCPQTS